jgi:hypothetical protein
METFRESDIEKRLEDPYILKLQRIMNPSFSETRNVFGDLFKKAKEEASKEGTSNLQKNFGAMLLKRGFTDQRVKSWLAMKPNEGVRDEDISVWWNTHDFERRTLLEFEDMKPIARFFGFRYPLHMEKMAKKEGEFFPIYRDPNEPSLAAGDDRA